MAPRTFCPGAVAFDGSTSTLNAAVTATDSNYATVSAWFRSSDVFPGDFATMWENNPNSYSTKFLYHSGVLQMSFNNPTGTAGGIDVYQNFVTDWFDNQWHHILVSVDMHTSPKVGVMVIDGVDVTGSNNSFGAAAGNLALNGYPFHFGTDTFADPYTGKLTEVWIMPGLNLITGGTIAPADIAKFYDGSCPVDLGADGSIPTGSPPPIYVTRGPSDPASAFLTNLGTGGNFTAEAGVLTTADGPCACVGGQRGQGYIF